MLTEQKAIATTTAATEDNDDKISRVNTRRRQGEETPSSPEVKVAATSKLLVRRRQAMALIEMTIHDPVPLFTFETG